MIFFFNFFVREDRRRGIHGQDYGEDDDEIDYSKKYDDDTALLVNIYLLFSCFEGIQAPKLVQYNIFICVFLHDKGFIYSN